MKLTDKIFTDENAARAHLEKLQWPDGPVCPHCGVVGNAAKLEGKSTRPGVYKCRECGKPFSVTVGTVFERSHVPLNLWLLATQLMCSSKKGMSAHQLHRTLGVTYKTAWFMAHRIREAMAIPGKPGPMGGEGKFVEADETYMGSRKGRKTGPSTFVSGFGWTSPPRRMSERKIMTLVERGGTARSFHVDSVNRLVAKDILFRNVDRASTLMTDEAGFYKMPGAHFAAHHSVNHSAEEWVRDVAHSNTVEGFFSIFKRGMRGVYQHCGEQHLHRYLAEFDFRYSNRAAMGIDDAGRCTKALMGAVGKRLTYRRTCEARVA
jgi:transposase-like protein